MTDKPRLVYIETSEARRLAAALIGADGVIGVHLDGEQIRVEASDAGELAMRLPAMAVDAGITLSRVEPVDESLESVFRYLVEGR
jgi:ABC-2 type transport system ATP-binding protein